MRRIKAYTAYTAYISQLILQKCCPKIVINIPAAAECSSEQFHPVVTDPPSPSDWLTAEDSGTTY